MNGLFLRRAADDDAVRRHLAFNGPLSPYIDLPKDFNYDALTLVTCYQAGQQQQSDAALCHHSCGFAAKCLSNQLCAIVSSVIHAL